MFLTILLVLVCSFVCLAFSDEAIFKINCSDKIENLEEKSIVRCPADCRRKDYKVDGNQFYSISSTTCAAAIHAGAISNDGGLVMIKGKYFENPVTFHKNKSHGIDSSTGTCRYCFSFQGVWDATTSPTSDSSQDKQDPPTSDGSQENKDRPTSDGFEDKQHPPTSDGFEDKQHPPTSDGFEDKQHPPTSDGFEDKQHPPTSDVSRENKSPPTFDDSQENKSPPTLDVSRETKVPPTTDVFRHKQNYFAILIVLVLVLAIVLILVCCFANQNQPREEPSLPIGKNLPNGQSLLSDESFETYETTSLG